MTFRVIARELDNGDFEPLVAFSVDAQDFLNEFPIDDFVSDMETFIASTNGCERIVVRDLANVEDVMAREFFENDEG